MLQGNGNAIRLNVVGDATDDLTASGHVQAFTDSAFIPFSNSTPVNTGTANITFREAFGKINRLSVGLIETAFADANAVPTTLDLAGPNARVTVQAAGVGSGQGRLSYDLFNGRKQNGFLGILSLEQATPQIQVTPTTGTFARYPDFIATIQYNDGINPGDKYYERWHLKFGSVFRSLGLEDSTNTFRQTAFGWGTSLSGSYKFNVDADHNVHDRVLFSVTYGQGISHYITDLNAAPDAFDVARTAGNVLVPLPVLAWYCGYTHNWTDCLASTLTYSQVSLDSNALTALATSPYRVGEYAGVNLLYHDNFTIRVDPTKTKNLTFYTGLEYLFGHKETLNGADGDSHRIMWVTAITN